MGRLMAAPTTGTGGGSLPGKGGLPKTTTGAVAPDTFVPQINNAATTYGVPDWLLTGIFGMETDFGRLVNTSRTGAVGLMQFEPATAAQYNYPLTNNPTPAQAQEQFNAAAHYLADLKKQYGSWSAAIIHYSGGGYTITQVEAKAHQKVPANEAVGAGINVNLPNPLSGAAQIAALLTSTEFWLRLGEALAGIILLAMGLRSLTGNTTSPASVVRAVRHRV